MTLPTLDQTAAMWIMQTWGQEYCYVQDIFPADTSVDCAHRNNCWLLIKKHFLMPEVDDGLKPYRRFWDMTVRYHLTPGSLHLLVQSQTRASTPEPSEVLYTVHAR
jgi:hypothetical protein